MFGVQVMGSLVLLFLVPFNVCFGPFMSTVFAFVRVLELFDVNDYRSALLNIYGRKSGRCV
jgi:hypothetical protein